MSELRIDVVDIAAERWAAAPTLAARLAVAETTGETVHAIALRVQLRIEPQRRGYSEDERGALLDLFGEPERFGSTLKPFLWTHATTLVPGFSGRTEVSVPVPCTYDFDVAAAKYLHALDQGTVPLSLLFNGTVFARGETGFAVTQVPWNTEAAYRMPVAVWRQAMDYHFPGSAWIRVERDTLTRLQEFKARRAVTTWEDAFARLLKAAGEVDAE